MVNYSSERQGKHLGKNIAFTLFVGVVLLLPFLAAAQVAGLHLFDLSYNSYALLSMAGVILNIIFLASITRFKLQGEETTWLLLYIGALSIFAFGEMMQRFAVMPNAAIFWTTFGGIGAEFLSPALFLFALCYTRPTRRHPYAVAFVLLAGLIMAYFQVHTPGLIFSTTAKDIHHFAWGYNNDIPGTAYTAQLLWIVGLFVAGFSMLLAFRRNTPNRVLKKQAGFFMIAFGIPVFGGIITDLVLPAINVDSVPPLATFFSLITAGMLTYGMTRYKALRISPSILAQSILSTMRESVVVINSGLQIEYMNIEAEKVFGHLKGDHERTLPDLLRGMDAEDLDHFVQKLKHQPAHSLENLQTTNHLGEKIYLRAQVTKLKDDALTEGYLLAITDVTELTKSYDALAQTEKKLEEEKHTVEQKVLVRTHELAQERARLESSINALNAGYLMIDVDDKLQLINGAAVKILFGDDYNEDKTKITLEDIIRVLGDTCKLTELIDTCLKTQKPVVVKTADFDTKIVQLFVAPVTASMQQASEPLGVVVLIEDITEAKVQERSRDEFFSIASHELRTPLTAIRGNTSMMQQYYPEALKDPDLAHMVDDIHESSTRLIEIVSDFLDVSSIEQHKINLKTEAFDIHEIIEDVMYELGTLSKEKKLSVTAPKTLKELPLVLADKNRIKQVLYNLTGNAIKFTEKGSITIETAVQADLLKVSITDSGRGIAEDMQKLLFHKFQQAGKSLYTRDTTRGTGLGLYISRLLVEQMGGELLLEHTTEGKGSTFSFTLPIEKPAK